MITGDNNLVEVQATVRFRLRKGAVQVFLFEVRDVDNIIRSASESVLRGLIASRRFTDLLTTQRSALQLRARALLQQRCVECKLGIDIEGFALNDLHPPRAVVDAYHEVTKAMEIRDTAINEAKRDAVLAVGAAETDFVRRVLKAEVAKTKEVNDAKVKWTEYIAYADARHRLGTDAEILDTRLYWDRLGRALLGRDVLLIDAPQLGGRRMFFLMDFDPARLGAPALVPTDRNSPMPPRAGGDKSP